jgi:hypothetical protein
MATLPIVRTEADKYRPIVDRANQEIPDYVPIAQLIATEAAPGQQADLTVRLYHDQVIAKVDSYPGTGGFTSREVGAGPVKNITPSAFANSIVLQRGDLERDPGLLPRVLVQVGNGAQRALDDAVFDALAAAFSTTYNDGTGTPYLVNAVGGTLHSGKAGAFTQSNNVGAALSESALHDSLVILRRWKNWADGVQQGLGAGPKALVVPPELRSNAIKFTNSADLPFANGANVGMAMNDLATMSWIVLDPTQLTNVTRWFVIDRQFTPIRWKVFIPPRITVRDGDNHTTIVEVSLEVGAGIVGPPDGLVGSSA